MINLTYGLIAGITLVFVGFVLFLLSSYKVIRRFYVMKIRLPIRKWLRYRPARAYRENYELYGPPENGKPDTAVPFVIGAGTVHDER